MAGRFAISTFQTFYWLIRYLAFDRPVALCHCNCNRKIGLPVDDWQVVVNDSSPQCIHSMISQLCVLSLVLTSEIITSVGVLKYQHEALNQNILVAFDFFQFWRDRHNITVVCVQPPGSIYCFILVIWQIWLEGF